jgi:O-acetyl-ADP-ribose deacetylase (regulator of RNase III)
MKNPEGRIEVVSGDVTKLEVDAIVNAANTDAPWRRRG